jgi:hypothetical protein
MPPQGTVVPPLSWFAAFQVGGFRTNTTREADSALVAKGRKPEQSARVESISRCRLPGEISFSGGV